MNKTRVDMIIETLRDHPSQKFTAKELASEFVVRYPVEMQEKQTNPRYATHEELLVQLAAEIGGERTETAKLRCPNVANQDKPRPRLYYWNSTPKPPSFESKQKSEKLPPQINEKDIPLTLTKISFSESELYPLLMEFLHTELKLYCMRINEKTSRNSFGSGGNRWLHPDIVALEPLDQHWDSVVKDCTRHGNNNAIRLWSFEVKKHLTRSNVRESFFQAVSNSTWANFGYLVATGINNDVEEELQMLASLHGIGVLLLNTHSLFDSEILIPARERTSIDWQTVNRIVSENSDFHRFIEQIGIYSQTRRLVESAWNN